MNIKTQLIKQLDFVYNVALEQTIFDQIAILGIGKKIQQMRDNKHANDQLIINNQLIEAWLSEYTNESHKRIARILLTNQLDHFTQQRPTYGAINVEPLLLGIAARLIKQLMVFNDIIGIQPMTRPVDSVYQMRCTPGSAETNSAGESTKQRVLELTVHPIESHLQKLHTVCTAEAVQTSLSTREQESEIIQIISNEIMTEITYDIISDLMILANKNPVTLALNEDNCPTASMLRFGLAARWIASTTNRGVGNVIITSDVGAALLQLMVARTCSKFVSVQQVDTTSQHAILHVGDIMTRDNRNIYSVYVTTAPVLDDKEPNIFTYLVGYKGISATDTGYIYSPHIPVVSSTGIGITPDIVKPSMPFITRRSKWVSLLNKETELESIEQINIVNSSDYYVSIRVDANDLCY